MGLPVPVPEAATAAELLVVAVLLGVPLGVGLPVPVPEAAKAAEVLGVVVCVAVGVFEGESVADTLAVLVAEAGVQIVAVGQMTEMVEHTTVP